MYHAGIGAGKNTRNTPKAIRTACIRLHREAVQRGRTAGAAGTEEFSAADRRHVPGRGADTRTGRGGAGEAGMNCQECRHFYIRGYQVQNFCQQQSVFTPLTKIKSRIKLSNIHFPVYESQIIVAANQDPAGKLVLGCTV